MSQLYDIKMLSITGEEISFSDFREQALLIVNLASQWGLTPQYTGLCALQEKYADEGFQVLGFPCNQFGAQEPGSDEEILEFARSRYNVNFPMFSKIEVNGENACELYKQLKAANVGEEGDADIGWNFAKFLVNKKGGIVDRIGPRTTPEEIEPSIAKLL